MLYPLPSGNSVEPDAVTCVYAVGQIVYIGTQFGQTIRAVTSDTMEGAMDGTRFFTRELNELKTPKAAIQP
jgi:hypothetical protein